MLLVWLYNNTGQSVFAVAWMHVSANVSWQLFPNQGSHWDPRVNSLVVALAAALIVAISGSRTLIRRRG